MNANFEINGHSITVDLDAPIDISIPLRFNGPQPNAYGVEPATSKPVKAGDLVGDTRLGGSVNFETYTFIPHCNGTHTECVGHITNERISIRDCLKDVFIPSVLISVSPEFSGDDLVISRTAIESAITDTTGELSRHTGLIVRTLPNDPSKLTRQYDEENIPPYFTNDAIECIVERGFNHLLVDLPSIDRLFDDGKLWNHRKFWNVEPGQFKTYAGSRIYNTITELVYIPNEVKDGKYILNSQVAPFESDAAPSRPVLFNMVTD